MMKESSLYRAKTTKAQEARRIVECILTKVEKYKLEFGSGKEEWGSRLYRPKLMEHRQQVTQIDRSPGSGNSSSSADHDDKELQRVPQCVSGAEQITIRQLALLRGLL
jgi:hypothetical protein